ncbi:MAG: hypothetical protein R6U32_02810 [Candidatus Woesearchaeota archaeon]
MISRMMDGKRKGFVLTLDIAVGALVAVLLLTAAHTHVMDAGSSKISGISMALAGSDITAVLDQRGILESMDEDFIESEMESLLPQNCMMRLRITTESGTELNIGKDYPEDQHVVSGKRFFAIRDSEGNIKEYACASYWVWKE